MLTEERYAAILKIVDEKRATTVAELTQLLECSESTIRRDLTRLSRLGKLNKVHGGATSLENVYNTQEEGVSVKSGLYMEEKKRIARCAAALVKSADLVYLDAGTTTGWMLDYLTEKNAVYVTCGITLATRLAQMGFTVYILSGRVKGVTEAIIGGEAYASLKKYHFTKGFFGTNGVSLKAGYSTPDIEEGRMKTEAMRHCSQRYILSDPSKFGKTSAVTFAELPSAAIVTTLLEDKQYKNHTNVLEADAYDHDGNF